MKFFDPMMLAEGETSSVFTRTIYEFNRCSREMADLVQFLDAYINEDNDRLECWGKMSPGLPGKTHSTIRARYVVEFLTCRAELKNLLQVLHTLLDLPDVPESDEPEEV